MALVAVSLRVRTPGAYCLHDVQASDLRGLQFGDIEYALPVAVPRWDTAGPLWQILRIILEEELRVQTAAHLAHTSMDMVRLLLGCTDADGTLWNASGTAEERRKAKCQEPGEFTSHPLKAWVALDVWLTSVSQESFMLASNAGYMHAMGYHASSGLFARSDVIERARGARVLAMWWEAYVDGFGARDHFSSVFEVDTAIRQFTNFSPSVCPHGGCLAGTIRPLCDGSPASADEVAAMREKGLECDGGWWYAPACATNRAACIPVVLAEFEYGVISWCKTAIRANVPLAITWVGWNQEQDLVKGLETERFLFYWSRPDTAFMRLQPGPPEEVFFDARVTGAASDTNPMLMLWGGVRAIDPGVHFFLEMARFADDDLDLMMIWKAEGATDEEVACRWLRDSRFTSRWREWLPSQANSTTVRQEDESEEVIFLLLLLFAVPLLVLPPLLYGIRRRLRIRRLNKPSNPTSVVGAEVARWVGPHAQGRLKEIPGNQIRGGWSVNASPFRIHVSSVPLSLDGQRHPNTVSGTMSFMGAAVAMEPWTFRHGSFAWPTEAFHLALESLGGAEEWQALEAVVLLSFEPSDFSTSPTGVDTTAPDYITYRSPVARKTLPPKKTGEPMGQIKVTHVCGMLLVQWSPPHISRGVPIDELQDFLRRVIEHPKVWEGCEVFGFDGTCMVAQKPPSSHLRDMYDANRFIVRPEAAIVDMSYAELRTDYGPPDIFVSHVWGETANKTLEALQKMRDWITSQTQARSAVSRLGCELVSARLWVCTLCNNQSRVLEELGGDVLRAPFAQVLRLPCVSWVALVSPFRALHRKWCNYEFSLSGYENKVMLMLTDEGVVQAGHVAPKTLQDLAREVSNFDCRAATCKSDADARFIDDAVERTGGYEQLTASLKGVFREAILRAHQWLEDAVMEICDNPSICI